MSVPRVVRNDWSTVEVPELGRWRPELTVSVVIPAYQCQASLDLTLASLSRQTYPDDLLEVVVVDDGSDPPLTLPPLRPVRCRMVRPASGWGRANALGHGVDAATGQILHWLDADMIAYPTHVEAQARWHHQLPYAVTLGDKRFVDVTPGSPHWPTPQQAAAGDPDQLFAALPSTPHTHVEQRLARTGGLRHADHLGFLAHVGATAALRRELYDTAGGLDRQLRLAEDTELGYRLAQAGAVFVPEPASRSWHLGPSHMMRHERQLHRYTHPFLADRMPLPRWLRRTGGTGWSVPLVTVVMEVDGHPLEQIRAAVDAVLASDQPDLQVVLVGPWDKLDNGRVAPLADPRADLRLVAATYRGEPRVRLAGAAPATAFPSPYQLTLPATTILARSAVRRLVEHADQERLGLVRAGPDVTLWRTAAVHRATWVHRDGEPLATVVAEVHGTGELDARVVTSAAAPWLPASVEVAGVRSLLHATGVVARHSLHRLRRRRWH